jgi:putative membrane protein
MAGSLGIVLLDSHGLTNFNIIPMTRLGLPSWGWEFIPLFTGLFGLPSLLMSLSSNPAIPAQLQDARERISRKRKAKGMLFGAMTGAFMGWFPGITSSQAGVLASQASSDIKGGEDEEDGGAATEEFMVSLSAINTADAITNFVALFVILRTRSGAAKAAQDMLGNDLAVWANPWPIPSQLLLILLSILVSSVLAYFMTIRLGRLFAKHFHRVPYRKLVASVIILLVVLVLFMAGPLGLAIMAIAAFLGLIPSMVGVKRVHLVGCLILPILASWLWGVLGWGVLM